MMKKNNDLLKWIKPEWRHLERLQHRIKEEAKYNNLQIIVGLVLLFLSLDPVFEYFSKLTFIVYIAKLVGGFFFFYACGQIIGSIRHLLGYQEDYDFCISNKWALKCLLISLFYCLCCFAFVAATEFFRDFY